VVPTFYDSIQTRGDRILAWFKRRAHIGEVVPASMAETKPDTLMR